MTKTTAQVSDDRRPMTGTWYRSTIDPTVLGKMTAVSGSGDVVTVTMTGGRQDVCTINEFADFWELS
ncbi:MAG: hypothetical protein ABWY81_06090 [Jiangellaceae bacterium]